VALTLDAAVAEARAASPARRAAQLRAQAARAAAPWAGAYANPSVDIRTENWQPGGRTANDPLNDTFVVVTQPIEVSGKAGARRRLAEADAASKDIDVRRVERQLVLDVARSYLAAARALGRQVVLAAQAESTHEVVTILARRVAEGVTPEADLRKVEADVARLDTEATRVEIDLQANLALLGALLGREVPVARTDIVPPDAAAWHVPPPSQDALAEVPEVAAARQRAAAAAVAYDLARRERWPDLLVSGGYKRTAGVDTAVAGVSVSVPVFTRGRREVALGNAERLAAEQDAIAAERLARAEAAARLAEAQLLSDRAGRVERDVLVPAEIAWRAARSSFQEGAGDVLRLLDAERVYGDARREASDLRLEAVLAQVRAQLALGDKQP
jgi:cobalt-zinc-cadmium efflux system outer membrane protein